MRGPLLLLFALPAGCPICPASQMRIVQGNREGVVLPAEIVQLEATYGDWHAGASRCGEHWYVDGMEGGSAERGRIDDCGRYVAPDRFPPGLDVIEILAAEYPPDTCLDCCPYAVIHLRPAG